VALALVVAAWAIGVGLSASFASFAGAAAARHALVLDDLAIQVVLRLDNAAKEHPAVNAGVRVILFLSGWVRRMRGRLIHVNTSVVLAAPPGDTWRSPRGGF
jgi:hypothetical protein